MAAGDLVFGISLEEQVSAPAHKAAKAVDDLSNNFKAAKSQLAFFQSQLNLAKNLGDIEGYRKFSEAVANSRRQVFDLGNELGQAPAKAKGFGNGIVSIRDSATVLNRALEGVSRGVGEIASALKSGDAAGAIHGVTDSLAGMAQALDLVVPGLGQIASAAIKVGGAFVAMTVGVVQSGVEMAVEVNAVNDQLKATFEALGHGPDAGEKTLGMLDDMARTLPQSRDELAKWTREVEKMGVTDLSKVRQEVLATASAQAILGEGGDAAYTRISRKVHDAIEGNHKLQIAGKELTRTIGDNLAGAVATKMGMSLSQLETKLKAGTVDAQKFGDALEETLVEKGTGPLDKMWGKTSRITDKLKESFGQLFSNVDTKPLTDAMVNLLALFDQTQPSGQAMKSNITEAFNGIIKALGHAITEGEVWFLEMEVYILSMRLALKPLIDAIHQVGSALEAVGIISKKQAPAVGPPKTVTEMKVEAVENTGLRAAQLLGGPILGYVFGRAADLGHSIGEGLVNAMYGDTSKVAAAGKQLGEAAVHGAREGAQVHSPSRLTMQIGDFMAQGLAIGMTQSAAPENAGRQLSGNALGGMVGQMLTSPPANQNGGGGGVNISGLAIHITAPQGVTDAAGLSASGLVAAFEKLQLASGR